MIDNTSTFARIDDGFSAGGVDPRDIEWLIRQALQPWARRAWTLVQRDQAIVELAGTFENARAVAKEMHLVLDTYCGGQWRFERNRPPPSDPVHALYHRILMTNGGTPPGFHTIRRVLAGIGAKSPRADAPAAVVEGESVGICEASNAVKRIACGC
jgi:hypothetical protein